MPVRVPVGYPRSADATRDEDLAGFGRELRHLPAAAASKARLPGSVEREHGCDPVDVTVHCDLGSFEANGADARLTLGTSLTVI